MESMFANIESIIKNYEDTNCDIDAIFYNSVMESTETVTSIDDTENRRKVSNRLKEIAEKLVENLKAIIQKYSYNFKMFIKKVSQTDLGFTENCRKAIRDNKPLTAVKLITYGYNDNALDTEINKITSIILKKISLLKTDYVSESDSDRNDMDSDFNELEKTIFNEAGAPKNVTNSSIYFLHIRDIFREVKKETLFKASETNMYYKIATSYKDMENKVNARAKTLSHQVNTIHAQLNNIIKNPEAMNEVKRRAVKQYKNATHLFNLYTSILDMYARLKLERILTYRTVLKKIYHFS